jgi:spermidine synthase/MFS family permease
MDCARVALANGKVTERNYLGYVFFALFFCSGFCSLLYEIVWARLAFAHFGIITPVLSVVISVFMLGLGVGSVVAGQGVETWSRRFRVNPIRLYAAAEFGIGIGAFTVPWLFQMGEDALLRLGDASSSHYLLVSGLYIAVAILPWCVLMGATFPLMMSFIRRVRPSDTTGFSFLYLANVIGAAAGAALTAGVLIELLGFRQSGMLAALVNFTIAIVAFFLGGRYLGDARATAQHVDQMERAQLASEKRRWISLVLFTTGFASLAMEVVWTRAFTFVLLTTIYSFAAILTTYLLATWFGSLLYRRHLANRSTIAIHNLLGFLCLSALLPVVLDDPRLQRNAILTLASIVPICAALGYMTPKLIDEYSHGRPASAGRSYGWNIAGGILGPLVAAYLLLPLIGVRAALALLATPFIGLYIWSAGRSLSRPPQQAMLATAIGLLGVSILISRSFEDGASYNGPRQVRRDHVATVIAAGSGMDKQLLVNGVGITALTPITKVMAHLPLALNGHAHSGLVICFGMGTTARAMLSWGIETTAVDLVPSVPELFGFFFADAPSVLSDPRMHIVIDDGRRFLLRTSRGYDVIAIDPPPPVEAAGSSLLYSREFYGIIKTHLKPNGILAQWFPGAGGTLSAAARSLTDSFQYVAVYRSVEGWGVHLLASETPIPEMSPAEFAARLPAAAQRDLIEWGPNQSLIGVANDVLSRRVPISSVLQADLPAEITDDRPYNEYFIVRDRSSVADRLLRNWRKWALPF